MASVNQSDLCSEKNPKVKLPIITHRPSNFTLEKSARNPRGSKSTVRSSGISVQKASRSSMKSIPSGLE